MASCVQQAQLLRERYSSGSYEATPSRFFLVRLLPHTYPPITAIEAATARSKNRTKTPLDPRTVPVAVVVSVTVAVVVTLTFV